LNPLPISQLPLPALENQDNPHEEPDASEAEASANLVAFGSSEFAKVVLNSLWGTPPPLDLEAEAGLHSLLETLAARKLITSARDISDGGIAVAAAQATFARGIGATIEQEQSLTAHPLFGLFAEPASTMLISAPHQHVAEIEHIAGELNLLAARIGTTGGRRLEISVDGQAFISTSIEELRTPWVIALEATLHNEGMA
jgi:phosphoribosylformylglycinamidine synthase